MSGWLDLSDNANCFKQTYVQGFVDISGGSIITRGTGGGLVIGGDASLNGTVYLGDSIFVRSDGLVAPGTADNGATPKPDISGNAENEATSYDISGNADNDAEVSGVYFPTNASWSQLGFDIDGEAGSDYSGESVSMINSATYGLVVAIGANQNDGTAYSTNTYDNRGHVRVYQYDANKTDAVSDQSSPNYGPIGWRRLGADIDGENAGDHSGMSVSLVDSSANGLVVAIGAYQNDGTTGMNSDARGHVRVYQYDANKTDAVTDQSLANYGPIGWNRLGFDIDGEAADDYSGSSVSLVDSANGLVVAIGAYFNDGNGSASGHVRVYQYDATKTTAQPNQSLANYGPVGWNRLGADIDGEGASDRSGYSVSLVDSSANGLVVAIGAIYNDGTAYSTNTNDNRGHVRVYQYDANKTTEETDQNSANYGPVGWRRLGADIDGENAGDWSGRSVSLVDSANGLVVAIGANENDGNGSNAGHVRVYQYDATKTTEETNQSNTNFGPVGWRRLGADIDGENAGDNSGQSVSLVDSANGLVVAIGAYFNDGNGSNAGQVHGHVRVYEIPYTKTYSDVFGGYYDISNGYLNDGLTSAALYVNGDTDLSGGLTVSGDVSFNAGNLFVAGDLSLNGNLFINSFAPNSIGADAIDSTVDIEFANKLSVSTSDISFNATTLQVATDFNSDNTPVNLAVNIQVPANIAIVDGSNGTVYGSYLTLTNKDATAYYNVGKSASGIFNIVNQANAGVYLTSGGTSFTGTSDARLKTNIVPLESATDKIMALNPCTYQWKSEVESATADNTSTNTKPHVGFIAQDVEKIMPELVHNIDHPAGPDYKGVNTTDMIPYLVRTIQENQHRIDSLRKEIQSLMK